MKTLMIMEGTGKETSIRKLMNEGKIPKMDFTATGGHIYEIQAELEGKRKSVGVDFHTMKPILGPIDDERKRRSLKELDKKVSESDRVYVFTDDDYEGEVIAHCLFERYADQKEKLFRGYTLEISEKGINDALKNAKQGFDTHLAEAGLARSALDRIIGWGYSTILFSKLGSGNVSAGRCQSPTLRFLAEREREIAAFVPSDYWTIHAKHGSFETEHVLNGKRDENENLVFSPESKDVVIAKLDGVTEGTVKSFDEETYETKPKAPFDGTNFMRACSTVLGIGIKEVTELSQKLYEKGILTYIRTDAIVLEDTKNDEIRAIIEGKLGSSFLPESPVKYVNPPSAQAGHMGISPVNMSYMPSQAKKDLDEKSAQMYELVWRRCVASQMKPAIYSKRKIVIDIGGEEFFFTDNSLESEGFLKVWNYATDEDEDDIEKGSKKLERLEIGAKVPVKSVSAKSHTTKAKPRYNTTSCLTKMKTYGIGRPGTSKNILDGLEERGYMKRSGKKESITVLQKGLEAVDAIMEFASNDIMNFGFTKKMEDMRDDLMNGKLSYEDFMASYYENVKNTMETNGTYIDERGFVRIKGKGGAVTDTGRACPKCKKGTIVRKETSKGEILSCSTSKFSDGKRSGCDYFSFLGEYEKTDEKCPSCSGNLIIVDTKVGKMKKCEFSSYDSEKKVVVGCGFKSVKL